jgi:hypothetical protein
LLTIHRSYIDYTFRKMRLCVEQKLTISNSVVSLQKLDSSHSIEVPTYMYWHIWSPCIKRSPRRKSFFWDFSLQHFQSKGNCTEMDIYSSSFVCCLSSFLFLTKFWNGLALLGDNIHMYTHWNAYSKATRTGRPDEFAK